MTLTIYNIGDVTKFVNFDVLFHLLYSTTLTFIASGERLWLAGFVRNIVLHCVT